MEESRTVAILSALAHGVNPSTGELFGSESPYQQAEVVRALFAALDRFKRADQPAPPKAVARNGPSNMGKPWSDEEDRKLLTEFDRGRKPAEIARDFGRTLAGIEARLERHGRLSAGQRTTSNRYPSERQGSSAASG